MFKQKTKYREKGLYQLGVFHYMYIIVYNAVLDCSQPPEEDLQPILRKEVEIAVASLKKGKSAGVDNIPAELVQAGGETMIDVLTEICNRIWRTGEWPTPWTQSLIITLPKKDDLQLCQNYRTISFISHSSPNDLPRLWDRIENRYNCPSYGNGNGGGGYSPTASK